MEDILNPSKGMGAPEFMVKALGLDRCVRTVCVIDFAATGCSPIRFVDPDHLALAIVPYGQDHPETDHAVIESNPLIHRPVVDFALTVPPAGVFDGPTDGLIGQAFGPNGPKTRIDGQFAAIQLSMNQANGFSAFVVPESAISQDLPKRFMKMVQGLVLELFCERAGYRLMIFSDNVRKDFRVPGPEFASLEEHGSFEAVLEWWKTTSWWPLILKYEPMERKNHSDFPSYELTRKPRAEDFPVLIDLPKVAPEEPKIRLCVDGGGNSLRLKAMNPSGLLLLRSSDHMLGWVRDQVSKQDFPLTRMMLRARSVQEDVGVIHRIKLGLESLGAAVEVDPSAGGWTARLLKNEIADKAEFEQLVYDDANDSWLEINVKNGIRSVLSSRYDYWRSMIDKRIGWPLWDYQKDDVARIMSKGSVLYAAFMGAGKTRIILSCVAVRRGRRNLLVLNSRLIAELMKEAETIGFPISEIHVIRKPEDAEPDQLKLLNVVTYAGVWKSVDTKRLRPEKKGKRDAAKTIAHILRKTRFNTLFIDEAHAIKGGMTTKRGRYIHLVRAKHVVETTGTVVKSYPRQIYPLMLRAFGENTPRNFWAYNVPLMHPTGMWATSGTRLFIDKFVQIAEVSPQFEETMEKGKRSREIPIVPEHSLGEWYAMLAPKVLRRRRREPSIAAAIKIPDGDAQEVEFAIDLKHAEFYNWWLNKFHEWFIEQMEAERSGEGPMSSAAILAQLTKLQFAATVPQSSRVRIEGTIEWPDDTMTQKQEGILTDIVDRVGDGEKVIVFSARPDLLNFMKDQLIEKDVFSELFHGGIPLSKRLENKSKFQMDDDTRVLLMSFGCGNMGYNLPEGDTVWTADWDWTPSVMEQAEARILRSSWLTEERKKAGSKPKIRRAVLNGTVDEYMRQWVYVKSQGIGEAIDRGKADFDPDTWMSYKDFSLKMFAELGMEVEP